MCDRSMQMAVTQSLYLKFILSMKLDITYVLVPRSGSSCRQVNMLRGIYDLPPMTHPPHTLSTLMHTRTAASQKA